MGGALLEYLPADVPLIGVEVGVYRGWLSELLLDARPLLTLVMVDAWSAVSPNPEYARSGDLHAIMPQPAHDDAYADCVARVAKYRPRAIVFRARSLDIGAMWQPASLDFVFIDGDHSYQGCAQDISRWREIVRPGGIVCGHDYDNINYPAFGVKRAVDEAFGKDVILGDFMTWFARV